MNHQHEEFKTHFSCNPSVGDIVVPVSIDAVITPPCTVICCVAFTGGYCFCCVLRRRRGIEERAAVVWSWDGNCNCREAGKRKRGNHAELGRCSKEKERDGPKARLEMRTKRMRQAGRLGTNSIIYPTETYSARVGLSVCQSHTTSTGVAYPRPYTITTLLILQSAVSIQ